MIARLQLTHQHHPTHDADDVSCLNVRMPPTQGKTTVLVLELRRRTLASTSGNQAAPRS